MEYGCRIPHFRWQREHYILVGAFDPLFGVGDHSHVQLGVCCTCLVVPCVEEWSELQPQRLCIPPTDLVVGAFLSR
jgi:hypothetical protein